METRPPTTPPGRQADSGLSRPSPPEPRRLTGCSRPAHSELPPRSADAGDQGLDAWRQAVAARWPLLVLALLLGAGSLFPSFAQPPEPPEIGLVFHGGAEDGPLAAPVLATEVEIRVTGPIARARVTQRFTNPCDTWMEGVYAFPLPPDAAVDTLHLVIGDRVIEGQIHEKQQAERIYEQAKRQGVKASLVRQKRPNLFTTRVANVAPGEEVEVVLEYQQALGWEAGGLRLRFPMTLTPRYHPSAPARPLVLADIVTPVPSPGAWFNPVPAGLGVALHRIEDGVEAAAAFGLELARMPLGSTAGGAEIESEAIEPAQPLRLTVDLDPGFPLRRLESSHHRIDIEAVDPGPHGERYRVVLADGAVAADRDFELVWEPAVGAEPQATLFTEALGGDVYALLMVLPPDPESPGFVPLPRETVFVIDTSGSMGGASIRQAKAALLSALDRLRPEDSFNILAFSSTTRALFPGSWPAEPEVVERARVWVGGLEADGGTEMMPALLTALDGRPEGYGRTGARAVRQVIFITDGAVANEDQLFSAIEQHLGEARLFTVGIGSAPNSHFMISAAALGRGTATFIGNPHEVRRRMEELFLKLESPTLTGVEVVWDDPGAEMWPQRLPDLYAGEPVVVAARLIFAGDEVRLSGDRDGRFWEQRLAVDAVLSDAAATGVGIGKLWARRKIEALMGDYRRTPAPTRERPEVPERDALRQQVVEVALAHHLVSPFTSLVAVDVTPDRPPTEPLAQRQVPNVTPAGWAAPGQLPVGGTGAPRSLLLGLLLLVLAALAAVRLRARSLLSPGVGVGRGRPMTTGR